MRGKSAPQAYGLAVRFVRFEAFATGEKMSDANNTPANANAKIYNYPAPPGFDSGWPAEAGEAPPQPRVLPDLAPAYAVKRAITCMRTFAWAIAAGYKSIENRSYSTPYRGWIAIHSGTNPAGEAGIVEDIRWVAQADPALQWDFFDCPDRVGISSKNRYLDMGAIIGVAKLVGVVNAKEFSSEGAQHPDDLIMQHIAAAGHSAWLKRQRHIAPLWANDGMYWWLLESPIQFAAPVESKGAVMLWTLKPDLAQAVTAAAQNGPYGLPHAKRGVEREREKKIRNAQKDAQRLAKLQAKSRSQRK